MDSSTPISITRRSEQVPIFQGDDAAYVEAARQDFNRAASQEPMAARRLGDSSPLQEAAEAYDAAVADALPRAVMVTVQALGRKAYRRLLAEHPPRDGNEDDETLGFNQDAFTEALLEYFDLQTGEKTVTEPQFMSAAALVTWLEDLNDGNFAQLASAAVRVNEGGSPDPKASLGSQVARLSAVTSRSLGSTD